MANLIEAHIDYRAYRERGAQWDARRRRAPCLPALRRWWSYDPRMHRSWGTLDAVQFLRGAARTKWSTGRAMTHQICARRVIHAPGVDRLVILKNVMVRVMVPCMHAVSHRYRRARPRGARARAARGRSRGAAGTRPCADIGAIYLNGMEDAARLHPIEYSTAPAAARGRPAAQFILK